MTDEDIFMESMGNVWEEMRHKMMKLCSLTKQVFDEDVYSDTLLKCYDTIRKQGLEDKSQKGCENYFFKSFMTNLKRDKQYARVSKKDFTPDLMGAYEDYLMSTSTSVDDKIMNDLKEDFSILYCMTRAEENNDPEAFHLFNLKHLGHYTYKELKERVPNAKGIRQKVASVKRWMKENISRNELDEAFKQFLE